MVVNTQYKKSNVVEVKIVSHVLTFWTSQAVADKISISRSHKYLDAREL